MLFILLRLSLLWYKLSILENLFKHANGARWSSGSEFDCRSRGSWFESYTGLTRIHLNTRNGSPRHLSTKVWFGILRGLCLCKFDILRHRMLTAHKTGSEIVSPGRPKRLFRNVAQWLEEVNVKGWLNGWIVKSSSNKTGNFNFKKNWIKQ